MSIETALQLAAYLNRTLLLPPLYLCDIKHYIGWKTPSILLTRWERLKRTKEDEALCRDYDPTVLPPKTQEQRKTMSMQEREREKICSHYHSWTLTPWTYFYDLPKVLEGVVGVGHQSEPIRLFDRLNMSIAWMAENLGIQDLDKEVYWINDASRFHVRILDDSEYDYRAHPEPLPDPTSWKGRYKNTMLLSDLRARPERVIHFGSLFGIERVEARSEAHQALQQYITNNLDIWNQPILDAAKLAETEIQKWIAMTGRVTPDFLGAHLRTADGGFKDVVAQSLHHIMDWLTDMVSQDKTRYPTNTASSSTVSTRQDHNVVPDVEPTFLESCMGQPLDTPLVFLATDVHHPRVSPVMSEYWQKFPCTMLLSDFPGSLEILNGIRNTADNVHMLPYMIALMDAVLAAKGREFQGTEKSTFSNYITYHLWPEYHPDRPRPPPIQ
ncbi:hypothetical protein BGX34_009564 [Mortierella sp. NVP85]|nr:hypothetical protein BGX34_009564 [Mortierella sp. NVP85]